MRNSTRANAWSLMCAGLVSCSSAEPDTVRAQSDAVVIQRPTIQWATPAGGAIIHGILDELSANCLVTVTSTVGVRNVQFFLDGSTAPLNTEVEAPYSCLWDTTTATNGSHTLKAIVTDKNGRSNPASVIVDVQNGGGPGNADAGSADSGTRPPGAMDYWVSSSGSDSNAGTTSGSPWASIGKVNGVHLNGGDIVHLHGTLTDDLIRNQNGQAGAPVTFRANGAAVIKGVYLTNASYVDFADLEAKGGGAFCPATYAEEVVLVSTKGTGSVRFINFTNMYLHDAFRAVDIGMSSPGATHTDINFTNTRIDTMAMDGVVLEDFAGDRFSYVGGSIRNTGAIAHSCAHYDYGAHGIYASGGHGHVFDGATFGVNLNGWSISMRRGDTTVRNCTFDGGMMLENVNEDPANSHRTYWVHDNVFNAGGASAALYQGGYNDPANGASHQPGNTWMIYDNVFNGSESINFADTTGDAAFYDVYMCNNDLDGNVPRMGSTAPGYTHDPSSAKCP